MRRIAIANLKGGAGKTTTAAALAVGLARRGHRVLALDLDPSANLSWTLGGNGERAGGVTIASVLTRDAMAAEAIRPTSTPALDLLPSDESLGGVNVTLAQQLGRDVRMRSVLDDLNGYDFAIADSGPTLTTLLANCLVWAQEVIIPTDPSVYSVLGLVAMERLIAEVQEAYNPALRVAGIVLTKVSRTAVARDIEKQLRDRYGAKIFRSVVPVAAGVDSAHSRGLTILDAEPKNPAALAYLQLVDEVLSHGGQSTRRRGKSRGRSGVIDAA